MDIHKIDPLVLNNLRKRGHTDEEIAAMTPEQAFIEYCRYHGMMRGSALLRVIDNLRVASEIA